MTKLRAEDCIWKNARARAGVCVCVSKVACDKVVCDGLSVTKLCFDAGCGETIVCVCVCVKKLFSVKDCK